LSGIYIHIPFCKQACHYCNFHFSTSLKQKAALLIALEKEIRLTTPFSAAEQIGTIYFGGGTPSLLSTAEIKTLLDTIRQQFNVNSNAEITLEANPDDINSTKLAGWRSAGINRLSLGIQSFLKEELEWMNRAHNAAQAIDCIELAKNEGFTDFSVDLIYGSPLLEDDQWKRNVDLLIKKHIPHISCYALTVEPKTALDKMILLQKKEAVDPDKQAAQFLLLMKWLGEAGYEHYEISNFAKPGFRSKHNSSYWKGIHYYGFGPSAHSFDGKKRKWNIANNALYIASIDQQTIPFEEETLTTMQQLNEYIMISLRTMEGLDLELVNKRFGQAVYEQVQNGASKYLQNNQMETRENKLLLTNNGKLLADGIAADLFFTEPGS